MKMETIECSETSAIRTQTSGNYPKENTLHIEHGESLKSRRVKSDLFVDFQINFFGCDWVAPGFCQCTYIELLQTTTVYGILFCFERFWYLNYSIQ